MFCRKTDCQIFGPCHCKMDRRELVLVGCKIMEKCDVKKSSRNLLFPIRKICAYLILANNWTVISPISFWGDLCAQSFFLSCNAKTISLIFFLRILREKKLPKIAFPVCHKKTMAKFFFIYLPAPTEHTTANVLKGLRWDYLPFYKKASSSLLLIICRQMYVIVKKKKKKKRNIIRFIIYSL